jgi:imidazolonepropionase-like amidohydrolase
MRLKIVLVTSVFLFLVSSCDSLGGQFEREIQSSKKNTASLVLVNGMLIDGTGSDPVIDAVVVIDGERIVAVGTRAQISIPPNSRTIDVQGATLLPGFINAHVHQAYDRGALEAWAQSGVTTVRDLGIVGYTGNHSEKFAFRDEVSHDPKYARLVVVGPMISVPGGYGSRYVTSPEHARETINGLLDDGADLIKISIEDDLQGRKWAMLSTEEITAIVETAHARSVPVSAHISRSKHLELALQTGVDDVAHMIVDKLSDNLIAKMIEDDMYWEPTLELWQCVRNLHQVNWDTQAIENLRRFSEAGGKVALGTDYSGYRCKFDLGMPMIEIELMLKAGMTPLQIIVAGTKNAAHVCNLEDDIGTLEPGKIADILVVAGNPLEDIHTLVDVQMVIHNGEIIRE